MQQVDYIIVGSGIAATSFAGQLLKKESSFVLYDDQQPEATSVAGGTLNPVVLKRFNPVWKASEFLEYAVEFYSQMETILKASFLNPIDIARVFHSAEEQNNWMVASDKNNLALWLDPRIQKEINNQIHSPFGIGKVQGGYQLKPKVLLGVFKNYLQEDQLQKESFDYSQVKINSKGVTYKNISARQIVFAEGAKINKNPFLNTSIIPKKGEYITVRIPNLDLQMALKVGYFVIPLGDDLYKIGATFAHGDFTQTTTQSGREQLEKAIRKITNLPFEVVSQEYGMRPTVKDRKPLIGAVKEKDNAYILNGLGTRGLLMAPLLSKWLYDFIELDKALPKEVNINRFY